MPATIRDAETGDAAALAALARKTFCETFVEGFQMNYPPEDLRAFLEETYAEAAVLSWIADPLGSVILGAASGDLMGFAQVGPNRLPFKDARPGEGELKRIYVRRSAQGLGLGARLLEAALERLGDGPVLLGVWSGNEKAIRLYRRFGFEVVGGYGFRVGRTLDDELILRRG